MRSRLALAYALPAQTIELREVILKDKPDALLQVSSKATVPVLVVDKELIIDESLDIMIWALNQHDPDHWMDDQLQSDMYALIERNDGEFKWALDRYKYADRYDHPASFYREKGEVFLAVLNAKLSNHAYLYGEKPSIADAAIFPFVRQFAHCDRAWFEQCDYALLRSWLNRWLESDLFLSVMNKYPKWQPSAEGITLFPSTI